MMNLSALSVARRLTLLTASATLGIMLLAAAFLWSERALILQEREASVRHSVEAAHGVLAYWRIFRHWQPKAR